MNGKSQNNNIIKLLILGSVITFLFILIPLVMLYSAESNTFVLFIVLGGFLLFGILVVIIKEFNRKDNGYINDSIKVDDSDIYFKKHCDSISDVNPDDFETKPYSRNVKKNLRGDNFFNDNEEEKLFSLNTRDYDFNNYKKL